MRILLADDQPKVRFALRALLLRQAGVQIVGEAVEAEDLLRQFERNCPDLVLLAWGLPGLPSGELVARLRAACPHAAIIALSGRPEARPLALAGGADDFVSKIDAPEHLLEAVAACCPGLDAGREPARASAGA